jgi:hypothetical protein
LKHKYITLGLIASTVLLGCGKSSAWDDAAAQLAKAQADARAAGLPVEMSELPKTKLEPGMNAATHYNLALTSWQRGGTGLREDVKLWSDAVSANPAVSIVRKKP